MSKGTGSYHKNPKEIELVTPNNTKTYWFVRLTVQLLILSFVIDGIKISFEGKIGLYINNAIFVTEILCIIVILITVLLSLFGKLPSLRKTEKSFFKSYFSILFLFTVIFTLNANLEQITGRGNFRAIFIILTLGLCVISLPLVRKDIKILISSMIAIALINATYNLCLFYGFISPLDIIKYGYRGGGLRFSGFSSYPSYIGILCSSSCAAIFPYLLLSRSRNRLILLLIFLLCVSGIFSSMSRSAMVGLCLLVLFYIFTLEAKNIRALLTIISVVIIVFGWNSMRNDTTPEFVLKTHRDNVRPASFVSAVIISVYRPWGIEIGSFSTYEKKYNPRRLCGVEEPHSGIAQLLIYGGVISLVIYSKLTLQILFRFTSRFRKLHVTTQSCFLAYLSTFGVFSLEQGMYMSIVLFLNLFLLALAIKSFEIDADREGQRLRHRYERKSLKKVQATAD
ncbi:hypothetical protein N8626_01880 [bacterium]|nr:hypothetical protein [bacterium]